jgi:hypothetical protein
MAFEEILNEALAERLGPEYMHTLLNRFFALEGTWFYASRLGTDAAGTGWGGNRETIGH